jgi:hypothetical protein
VDIELDGEDSKHTYTHVSSTILHRYTVPDLQ